MDNTTLLALKGSIKKWQGIVAGTVEDLGPANCPLCKLFFDLSSAATCCTGCPVRDRTGFKFCRGTPYIEYCNTQDEEASKEQLAEIATKEVEFLKSLVPKRARQPK